jgi:ADP-heptose:LPS heptosyltransferase
MVISKIVILRALHLGDLLCTVPAFRALRKAFPAAHISLAGLPWAADFVKRFDVYLDEWIHFPGYPGLPEQPVDDARVAAFTEEMKARKFDLALQMQGNGSIVNDMMEHWDAVITAGFREQQDNISDPRRFLVYPDKINEIHRHLQLLHFLGIPPAGEELEFPLLEEDVTAFRQLALPFESKHYICIHPGSRDAGRQWPPACFAALADQYAAEGYGIVITGTAAETELADHVQSRMRYPALHLAGKTTLGSMAILIKEAKALFSNCTGVSHLAAAMKTPSVIINMDGEPERWAPLNTQLHYLTDWRKQPDYNLVKDKADLALASGLATTF